MDGIWTMIAAGLSFLITALLGKWMVPFLHKINFGQTIREIGPKWHQKKNGTPTMGGFMFIIGVVTACAICLPIYLWTTASGKVELTLGFRTTQIVAGVLMAVCFGLIGFIDDYIKVVKKRNLGLNVRQKLVLQFLAAGAYLLSVYLSGGSSATYVPLVGTVDLGVFYWILSLLGIVGIVNAVNFTDGIDGLNTSVTFFYSICFMLMSGMLEYYGMSIVSAATAGGCLGFLIWNFNPAKVFMGDTGSLFLGGIVCALGFGMNMPILILLVGLVYVVEILSVVLQVAFFKITHGKRIFKMTPIHHHFEMCGWSEVKICGVFSLVTIFVGVIAIWLVLSSFS